MAWLSGRCIHLHVQIAEPIHSGWHAMHVVVLPSLGADLHVTICC